MRTLYFLLPGTRERYACGGLWAELKAFQLAQQVTTAAVVTYQQREPDTLFLPDLLQTLARSPDDRDRSIFVLSWGFHVPQLAQRLRGYHCLYHAHSAGYGFRLPPSVPIISVSRNTLGYWGQRSPHALLYYLPNEISPDFCDRQQPRDLDVLVQARKSSTYLLQQLVPALESQGRVEVVRSYVEDLPALFNRAKVYLYDSAEYWAMQRVTEGFGLQPLEALACGCQVFSSVNGGLSDYLDPGFNSQKIAGYATGFDVARIGAAMRSPQPPLDPALLAPHRPAAIVQRLRVILREVNQFFDYCQGDRSSDLPPWSRRRLALLWCQQKAQKLRDRLF
ncbi:glycosyltransferase [Prochlorothrix hollandica]|uniref:glycosyltransferase n=1 Tax=Prochlorothrix hollandica TaxID=1223 RepID=UPI0033429B84